MGEDEGKKRSNLPTMCTEPSPEEEFDQALDLYRQMCYADAEKLFKDCLAKGVYEAAYYIGMIRYSKGDLDTAIKMWRIVIKDCEDELIRGKAQSILNNVG